MGGATRFMTLLSTPFPPLRPSLILFHRRMSSLSAAPLRLLVLASPCKVKSHALQPVNCFHSQPNNHTYSLHSGAQQQQPHPWPEWTHFLNILSNGQELSVYDNQSIPPEDGFVVYEELPDDFVRAAAACLAFARARPNLLGLLSRGDVEAVVSNGTPFIFKNALDTARRMRAFLGIDGSSGSEFDKANTVDVMKYILSYASNPTVSSRRSGLFSRELVDSSIRNLLHELGRLNSSTPASYIPASDHLLSGRQEQTPKPFGQNIEMKRGDWICSKCNFMNFARNMKCLECEEPRPKRQLIGGEWECPNCTFFNYGRNVVCLRCDCRKPGPPLFSTSTSGSGPMYNGDHSYKTNVDNKLSENEERAKDWFSKISQLHNATDVNGNSRPPSQSGSSDSQSSGENLQLAKDSASQMGSQNKEREQAEKSERWFKRMSELHNVKDLPSAVSDEQFPEIMPMRQGENRFVVSKKKDRSLASPKYKRQVAMDQASTTNFVPFVPFPPGYFARKDTDQSNGPDSSVNAAHETHSSKTTEDTEKLDDSKYCMADSSSVPRKDYKPISPETLNFSSNAVDSMSRIPRTDSNPMTSATSQYTGSTTQNSITSQTIDSNTRHAVNSGPGNNPLDGTGRVSSELPKNENVGWTGKSLEGSAVKESDPLDMSEEAKAERWFKRVAQIKDISELSQIPDEDFPSIMPMRKGVNRFVVSKRKTPLERRLTSQQYRRNLPIVSNNPPVKKESDSS